MNLRIGMLGLTLALAACAGGPDRPVIASKLGAVQLRSIQTRTFDTADRNQVLRAVIGSLQDSGYAILKVSPEAGTVTAVKSGALRLTASAYRRGETQTVVRANAVVPTGQGDTQVDDAAFYRDLFFEPLSRTLAIAAMASPDQEEAAPLPAVPPDSAFRTPQGS
jgi:hypothetical protein